jgi:hypothetical protein
MVISVTRRHGCLKPRTDKLTLMDEGTDYTHPHSCGRTALLNARTRHDRRRSARQAFICAKSKAKRQNRRRHIAGPQFALSRFGLLTNAPHAAALTIISTARLSLHQLNRSYVIQISPIPVQAICVEVKHSL